MHFANREPQHSRTEAGFDYRGVPISNAPQKSARDPRDYAG